MSYIQNTFANEGDLDSYHLDDLSQLQNDQIRTKLNANGDANSSILRLFPLLPNEQIHAFYERNGQFYYTPESDYEQNIIIVKSFFII